MDRVRFLPIGLGLLLPAAVMFAFRAALALFSYEPGTFTNVLTAISGGLSFIGLGLVVAGTYGSEKTLHAILAVVIALSGHYLVAMWSPALGAGMTYFGMGLAASIRAPIGVFAGLLAATGALMRSQTDGGHFAVLLGAIVLGLALFQGATGKIAPLAGRPAH